MSTPTAPLTETGSTATNTSHDSSIGPAAPSLPAPSDTQGPTRAPRRRRRLAELGLTAVLAAAVGSGATLTTARFLNDAPNAASIPGADGATAAAGSASSASATGDSPAWSQVAAKVSPSVVAISVSGAGGSGQGSGVVWDTDGHIVTNNHVVSGAGARAQISVQIGSQRSYTATVVGTDPTTDLAVLKLDSAPNDLTPINRSSAGVRVGDPVMALGNPLGLSGTATTGIVSAVGRPTTTRAVDPSEGPFVSASTGSQQVVTNAIQTSAAINPGNSGGALVDSAGRLIGINSSIASLSSNGGGQSGSIGIGFAIPVAEVSGVATQLIQHGTATHAALGIAATDAQVRQGAATLSGAGVRQVQPGSAAAEGGLTAGDLITAIDGSPVNSAESLVGTVRGRSVGDRITLTVVRDGATRKIPVTLEALKSQ